jgi:hypothetical protein
MKLRRLTGVFMVRIMLAAGITAGVAVGSAEGCDGPVLVAGSFVNTCGTCLDTAPHCPGYTDRRDDYCKCGGSGCTYCSESFDTVGNLGMPCTDTPNVAEGERLQGLYEDCLIDAGKGTTGGTPIIATKLSALGDYDGCMLAKLQESPSPSVVELALVTLRTCD